MSAGYGRRVAISCRVGASSVAPASTSGSVPRSSSPTPQHFARFRARRELAGKRRRAELRLEDGCSPTGPRDRAPERVYERVLQLAGRVEILRRARRRARPPRSRDQLQAVSANHLPSATDPGLVLPHIRDASTPSPARGLPLERLPRRARWWWASLLALEFASIFHRPGREDQRSPTAASASCAAST